MFVSEDTGLSGFGRIKVKKIAKSVAPRKVVKTVKKAAPVIAPVAHFQARAAKPLAKKIAAPLKPFVSPVMRNTKAKSFTVIGHKKGTSSGVVRQSAQSPDMMAAKLPVAAKIAESVAPVSQPTIPMPMQDENYEYQPEQGYSEGAMKVADSLIQPTPVSVPVPASNASSGSKVSSMIAQAAVAPMAPVVDYSQAQEQEYEQQQEQQESETENEVTEEEQAKTSEGPEMKAQEEKTIWDMIVDALKKQSNMSGLGAEEDSATGLTKNIDDLTVLAKKGKAVTTSGRKLAKVFRKDKSPAPVAPVEIPVENNRTIPPAMLYGGAAVTIGGIVYYFLKIRNRKGRK